MNPKNLKSLPNKALGTGTQAICCCYFQAHSCWYRSHGFLFILQWFKFINQGSLQWYYKKDMTSVPTPILRGYSRMSHMCASRFIVGKSSHTQPQTWLPCRDQRKKFNSVCQSQLKVQIKIVLISFITMRKDTKKHTKTYKSHFNSGGRSLSRIIQVTINQQFKISKINSLFAIP